MNIAHHPIGLQHPVFVIAELGVNHDGSLDRALELVSHAAAAGADAVKLQIFRATTLLHESSSFATYQKDRSSHASPADMLARYELGGDQIQAIVDSIRKQEMLPLATPFSLADVDMIERLSFPAVKIASPDAVNLPLLRRAAAIGRPLLISTGASRMEELIAAANWLREWRSEFAMLHCISAYPTPVDQVNLAWMNELARQFEVPIGFSDHTTEELTGAFAVAAGACIVEKHLTYDRAAEGPDHAASADPMQFSRYVAAIRLAERMRGGGPKRVLEIEEDVRKVSRQSLILTRPLKAGAVIAETDLAPQRPGTGIPAAMLPLLIGRKTLRDLPAGTMLWWDMIEAGA